MDTEYAKQTTDKTTEDIKKRLAENAKKPGSVNAAGGTGDETDAATVNANMTSEEFEVKMANVIAKASE